MLVPLLVVGSILVGTPQAFFTALIPSGLILVGMLIAAALDPQRPKVRTADSGWVRVGPVHPLALDFLRAAEREARDAAHASGRKWKVRTGYLNRWPYRMLIDRQTKLHEALSLFLTKTLGLRKMEYSFLEPGQEQDCALGDCHPALREAAESWAADHPDWSPLAVQYNDAPFLPLRSEVAAFADPTGRVLLEFACFWAKSKPDQSRCHVTVRSWLASGARIMTSGNKRSPVLAADVNFEHVDAAVGRLVARHLERLAGADPVSLAPGEMEERTRAEAVEELAGMEKRGWVSEVREVG